VKTNVGLTQRANPRPYRSPCEVIEVRQLTCSRAASLDGRSATESSVNTSLVVIGGESIQLSTEVETIPEEDLIEILAPKGSDQPLDEWMRARYEGDGPYSPR
jgi:hypothetical protein